jgi:hypothetical protein
MPFSTDRDLLALEPTLFNGITFASQLRLEVTDGIVSGATLTSASADFTNAGLEGGDVVLIANVPCEVIERVDAHTLTVSKLRGAPADAPIPPAAGTSLTVIHRTFEPQARLVHDELLRLLGIDPDGRGDLTEDSIVSLSVMRDLASLKTVAHVLEAAIALGGDDADHDVLRQRASEYRHRYRLMKGHSVVALDTDGDGMADMWRELGVIELRRA